MSVQNFETLCFALCKLLGEPYVALEATAEGPVAWHLIRNGVTVSVMHFQQACEDHAFLLFQMGDIPYEDPRAARVLLALLDCNFITPDPHAPAFGRNPYSGEAVIRLSWPLMATPEGGAAGLLLRKIDEAVELVHAWRQDFFLRDDAPQPGPGRAAALMAESSFS